MNMKKILLAVAGFILAGTAQAGDFDGSKVMLCATQNVSQCDAGMDCFSVFPESVNVPDFFVIDAGKKTIGAANSDRHTPVERIEHLADKLILQGADGGIEGERFGLAWSMAITEDTGKMTLSATGDRFAIVIFGACVVR